MTDIQQQSVDLAKEILLQDYYQPLFGLVLQRHAITQTQLAHVDDSLLVRMWNDFWMDLPDSPTIRRRPFFQLCNLCEQIFDSDEGDFDEQ